MGQTVGVIGLGNMGRGIAENIARDGHKLLVWDAVETTRAGFANISKPADMAAQADMIIFVVPSSTQIENILGEILSAATPGLVLWDFTTSEPTYTKRLALQAKEAGVSYMDAGMSGGAKGADAGILTLMIGGPKAVFERSKPVLTSCAKELIYLGPSGAGHTMKLVHNLITHTNFLACAEGGKLAEAAGIDLADMIQVLNAGNARSFISEHRFPDHILSETWDARSQVANLYKDVGMAVALSKEVGSPMRIGQETLSWLQSAMDTGLEDEDFSRLYPALEGLKDM